MKKARFHFQYICKTIWIVSLPFLFAELAEAKASTNYIVEKERYIKIDSAENSVFIDTVRNSGFLPQGTLYTLYKNDGSTSLDFYNLFVEFDLDNEKGQLEASNYFSAIEQLDIKDSSKKAKQ